MMDELTPEEKYNQQNAIETSRQKIEEWRFQILHKHPISEAEFAREGLAKAAGRYRRFVDELREEIFDYFDEAVNAPDDPFGDPFACYKESEENLGGVEALVDNLKVLC